VVARDSCSDKPPGQTASHSALCRLVVVLLLLLSAGEAHSRCAARSGILQPVHAGEMEVRLCYARLPSVLKPVAAHAFLLAYDPQRRQWNRWEVWQNSSQCGTSWEYVHLNLLAPQSGVGGGAPWVARVWRGADARRLFEVLQHPAAYPHHNRYSPWPGPNSNTFVAWVLKEAGVPVDFSPLAIGKDYRGLIGGGVTSTRTGLQLETPLLGLKAGVKDGVELHVMAVTLGIDLWPPALKTPFGRIGFRE
jgi:hypothetical protein